MSRRVLVVGLGEVGRPLYEILAESGKFEMYGFDIDPSKTINKLEDIPSPVDYLHICIPCNDKDSFVSAVLEYIYRFKPRLVIIHSTVPPGTTRLIHQRAEPDVHVVHSPVRGVHVRMKDHLRFWTKWIGPICDTCRVLAEAHLREAGFKVKIADKAETTELAKLWETTLRAILIAAWHEIHRTARLFNADILEIAEFIGEVHEVLHDRPVYYPDVIGGHCLIPNTKLLLSVYKSPLLEFVLESNEKRKQEVKDEIVMREIEALKRLCKKYWNLEYYGMMRDQPGDR